MRKERAQAIMEHIEAMVTKGLPKWRPGQRYFNGTRLQIGWFYKHSYLTVFLSFRNHQEAIRVAFTSPLGDHSREWHEVSAKTGEHAISVALTYGTELEKLDKDELDDIHYSAVD